MAAKAKNLKPPNRGYKSTISATWFNSGSGQIEFPAICVPLPMCPPWCLLCSDENNISQEVATRSLGLVFCFSLVFFSVMMLNFSVMRPFFLS